MNNIGLKTYEHIKELLYKKENKEITISSDTINYVIDYVDDLQANLDICIKSNKERQQRIDKAIEYTEENIAIIKELLKQKDYSETDKQNMKNHLKMFKCQLSILRGEENE